MKSFGKHGLQFGKQTMNTGFDKQAMKTLGKQLIKNFGKDTFQLGKKSFVDEIKRGQFNFEHAKHQTNGGMEGFAQKVGGLGMNPYQGIGGYQGKVRMRGSPQISGIFIIYFFRT
jgi:hypothetical protein